MTSTIVAISLICIIIPLIFRAKEPDVKDNYKIVFEFNKVIRIAMLICTIVFVAITLLFVIVTIYSKKDEELLFVIFMIFFALLAVISSLLYLLTRNKKVIYEGDVLYVFNIIGKRKIFNVQDITDATEINSDCMKLTFKDNDKVKIDIQMNNYSKIKEILARNDIVYKDKHGNNTPKGW